MKKKIFDDSGSETNKCIELVKTVFQKTEKVDDLITRIDYNKSDLQENRIKINGINVLDSQNKPLSKETFKEEDLDKDTDSKREKTIYKVGTDKLNITDIRNDTLINSNFVEKHYNYLSENKTKFKDEEDINTTDKSLMGDKKENFNTNDFLTENVKVNKDSEEGWDLNDNSNADSTEKFIQKSSYNSINKENILFNLSNNTNDQVDTTNFINAEQSIAVDSWWDGDEKCAETLFIKKSNNDAELIENNTSKILNNSWKLNESDLNQCELSSNMRLDNKKNGFISDISPNHNSWDDIKESCSIDSSWALESKDHKQILEPNSLKSNQSWDANSNKCVEIKPPNSEWDGSDKSNFKAKTSEVFTFKNKKLNNSDSFNRNNPAIGFDGNEHFTRYRSDNAYNSSYSCDGRRGFDQYFGDRDAPQYGRKKFRNVVSSYMEDRQPTYDRYSNKKGLDYRRDQKFISDSYADPTRENTPMNHYNDRFQGQEFLEYDKRNLTYRHSSNNKAFLLDNDKFSRSNDMSRNGFFHRCNNPETSFNSAYKENKWNNRNKNDHYENSSRIMSDIAGGSNGFRRDFTYMQRRERKNIPLNPSPSRVLGLFGLLPQVTIEDIRNLVDQCLPNAEYENMHLVKDKITKRSKGFAFIYFNTVEECILAKEKLLGKEISGKAIRVDFSISETPRNN
ncbi:hypothetical protein EDEG_00324 [Edhazardia aedis USNM 41457]|uniref:RRM domain-containing protein n=1 Tax=Edhazardia aedis (strain USNM 41457) TaxID=1003232 RepID=J8ZQJ3_EDHAE|nr:hypothetical protein EDEG_00324 [Edhazardia aedis USNM 41457]|eukprot:EJW01978.1 hypothetical protein EDEG_00324 [Edhazardia aedis USNM 41457]